MDSVSSKKVQCPTCRDVWNSVPPYNFDYCRRCRGMVSGLIILDLPEIPGNEEIPLKQED